MSKELRCRACGALICSVSMVSTQTFMPACHKIEIPIATFDTRVEEAPSQGEGDVRCYQCGELHEIYSRIDIPGYIIRRKKKK